MLDAHEISFEPTESQHFNSVHLQGKKHGIFTIRRKLKWTDDSIEKELKDEKQSMVTVSIRDAIITVGNWSIPISVWGALIDLLQEDITYTLTNVKIKYYFAQKLTTTTDTVIKPSEEQIFGGLRKY